MLYIHVDTDKRKYLEAIASARNAGIDFTLMAKNATPAKDATAFFSVNPDISEQWSAAGIEEYSVDSSVSKSRSRKSVDAGGGKSKESESTSTSGRDADE